MADEGKGAKRSRIEAKTVTEVVAGAAVAPRHGLEGLQKRWAGAMRLVIELLENVDVDRWALATRSWRKQQELLSHTVHRHYTERHHRMFETPGGLLSNLMTVLSDLQSLKIDDVGAMPDITTWSRIAMDAKQLQRLHWSMDEPQRNNGDGTWTTATLLPYMLQMPAILKHLHTLSFSFDMVHRDGGVPDFVHLHRWLLPANREYPKLQHLVLDCEQPWPPTMTRDVARVFPNLTNLDLQLQWNNDSLLTLVDSLPHLKELRLDGPLAIGEWMEAKTLLAFMDTEKHPDLQLVVLKKYAQTLVITGRMKFQLLDDEDDNEFGEDLLSTESICVLLDKLSRDWSDSVVLDVPDFRPVIKALLALPDPPRMHELQMARCNGTEPEDWSENADENEPWLATEEVRGLLTRVTNRLLLRTNIEPDRYMDMAPAPEGLDCNLLSPTTVFACLRAGIPLGRLRIGHDNSDDDSGHPNPDDTSRFSDELCLELLKVAPQQAATFTTLDFNARGQISDWIWDGMLVAKMLRAYPRLKTLWIKDIGIVRHVGDVLRALPTTLNLLELRTSDALTTDDWKVIRGMTVFSIASTNRAGGWKVTPTVLATLCTNNPHLELLGMDIPASDMQGSTPESDWSALRECKSLRAVRFNLPSPSITLEEIEQMGVRGPESRVNIQVTTSASYHPLHRWPQPLVWRQWLASDRAPKSLQIGTEQDAKAQAVTWADAAFEAKLVHPSYTPTGPPTGVGPEKTHPRGLFAWFAAQLVDVALVTLEAGHYRLHGSRTASTYVALLSWTVIIKRAGERAEVFNIGPADKLEDMKRQNPAAFAKDAIMPQDIVPHSVPVSTSITGIVFVNLYFAHLRVLNPTASAASIAQFVLRPDRGDNKGLDDYIARMRHEVREHDIKSLPPLSPNWGVDIYPIIAAPATSASLATPAATAPRIPPTATVTLPAAGDGGGGHALDVQREARLAVRLQHRTLDVERERPASQIVRATWFRQHTSRRLSLSVRHQSLVAPLQRILTPLLATVDIDLRVIPSHQHRHHHPRIAV
jgi:hypothetical protein